MYQKMDGQYDPYCAVYRPVSPSTDLVLIGGNVLDMLPFFSTPPEDYQGDSPLAAKIAAVLAPSWEGECPPYTVAQMKDLLRVLEEHFGNPVEVGMIAIHPGALQQAANELGILRKW